MIRTTDSMSMVSTLLNMSRTSQAMDKAQDSLSSGLKQQTVLEKVQSVRLSTEKSSLGAVAKTLEHSKNLMDITHQGLKTTADILTQMKSVALQAGGDNVSDQKRQDLTAEFDQLKGDLAHTIKESHFNDVNLLDGSYVNMGFIVGVNGERMQAETYNVTLEGLGIDGLTIDNAANAAKSIDTLTDKIDKVAHSSAKVNATINSLEFRQAVVEKRSEVVLKQYESVTKVNREEALAELNEMKLQKELQYYVMGTIKENMQSVLQMLK